MSKQIPLTNSARMVTVDDKRYDELSRWQWYLLPIGDMQYAARDVVDDAGNRTVVFMHLQVMYPRDPRRWSVGAETRAR